MASPINHHRYRSVPKPLGWMPDSYVSTEVISEEMGRTHNILSMQSVESEKMTRYVSSIGCDKNDRPMEEHTLLTSFHGTSRGLWLS
jgi:hypothetical protein